MPKSLYPVKGGPIRAAYSGEARRLAAFRHRQPSPAVSGPRNKPASDAAAPGARSNVAPSAWLVALAVVAAIMLAAVSWLWRGR